MHMSPDTREVLSSVWHSVAVAIVATVGAVIAPHGSRDLDILGYGLILASSLSLVALAWSPVVVVFATTVGAGLYGVLGYPGVAAAIPVMVALYKAVRAGHRWTVIVPIVGVGLGPAVAGLASGEPVREVLERTFLLFGWLVAAVAIAAAAREWRQNLTQAEERATEAERTRDEVARRHVAEERVRIARELHDSLTHSISVIRVQAGVALHLARKRGEDAPAPLVAIQEVSGDAVRELRATLDVLRDDDQPGLDRLDDLVERVRMAGVQVQVTISGEPRKLPADLSLAAYRIAQESLTNVARHAGAATAHVRITYLPDELTVQVDDDGVADPEHPPKPATGLTGMAERVEGLGGHLSAIPRPEGGFTVRANLPTDAAVELVAR